MHSEDGRRTSIWTCDHSSLVKVSTHPQVCAATAINNSTCLFAVSQTDAEEKRQSRISSLATQSHNARPAFKPMVTDSSVLKNDMKQRLAKERRQERKRQEEANKEMQLLEKERKAKLQFEKQLEEKQRKIKEQKEKDERRRLSSEKRKQNLEAETEKYRAAVSRTMQWSTRFDQRSKRCSWDGSTENTENKNGKRELKRSSSLNRKDRRERSHGDNQYVNKPVISNHVLRYIQVPIRSHSSDELKTSTVLSMLGVKMNLYTKLDMTPLEKADTPLEANMSISPKASMAIPSKQSEVPPEVIVEVPPQVNVEAAPKMNIEVTPKENVEMPPQGNTDVQPAVHPMVSIATTPMASMESPVLSLDSLPLSVESSPLVSVEASPVVSLDTSPETSMAISPEVGIDPASMEASTETNADETSVEVLPEVNVEENLEAHLEGKAGRSSDASMKGPSKDSITPPKVIVDVASQTSVDMPCKVPSERREEQRLRVNLRVMSKNRICEGTSRLEEAPKVLTKNHHVTHEEEDKKEDKPRDKMESRKEDMADEEPAEVQDEDGFQEQGLKMNKEFQPEDDHGFPQTLKKIMKRTRETDGKASETSDKDTSEEDEADDEDEIEGDEDPLDELSASGIQHRNSSSKPKMPCKNAMRRPQKLAVLQAATSEGD
ncbi:uncharacterized protein isoform X2 [Castor canadensis]|uniref:Uncharacterized protein isoform X2 n=1 Tax=Castor canadensis TaxID=51338 RepID=A0AC58LQN5_CASCN